MRQSPLFNKINTGQAYYDEANHATIGGVALKTSILLGITIAIAVVTALFMPRIVQNEQSLAIFIGVLIASSIIGFISVLVGRLSERASKYAGVIYSLCEGLALGAVTCIVEQYFRGIGFIAVAATLVIFGAMLLLYSVGILRSGTMLRKVLVAVAFAGLALALITTIIILILNLIKYTTFANKPLLSHFLFCTTCNLLISWISWDTLERIR